jgi:hypothetical protein
MSGGVIVHRACQLTAGFHESIIELVCDERVWQVAEVLLQHTGNTAYIEVWAKLHVVSAFKLILDLPHLSRTARFTIDTLIIHASHLDFLDAFLDDYWDLGALIGRAQLEIPSKDRH